jgi:hypothetical protein
LQNHRVLRTTGAHRSVSIAIMEAMRKTWTDERLDDFASNTDRRFDGLEQRMDEGFRRVDADIRELRGEMNVRLERIEERVDDVNRTMLRLGGGAIVTFVVGFAGLIATQL